MQAPRGRLSSLWTYPTKEKDVTSAAIAEQYPIYQASLHKYAFLARLTRSLQKENTIFIFSFEKNS